MVEQHIWVHTARVMDLTREAMADGVGSDKLAFKQFDRYVTLGSYCRKRMNALFWQDAVYSNYTN